METLGIIRRSAFVVSLALLTGGCDLCGEETTAIAASADITAEAMLMVRNCGATTGYVTHVNVFERRSGAPAPGLVGTVTQGEVLTLCGEVPVQMTWESSSRLILQYPRPSADCFATQIDRFGAVQITHQVQP